MRRMVLSVALMLGSRAVALAEPVSFAAADGVVVHADHQGTGGRPLILLFHMAGSNRHEYDAVVPKLNAAGFDTLAVDQRSGGSAFGHDNETARGVAGDPGYVAAYVDLEATLAWAEGQGAPKIIALGSSYSASLALVLAFSPGEYFSGDQMVRNVASQVHQPVFVSSASDAGEEAAAAAILEAVAGLRRSSRRDRPRMARRPCARIPIPGGRPKCGGPCWNF